MKQLTKNLTNINNKKRNIFLIIPYIIVTVVLVFVPIILIFVKSLIPVENLSIKDNWDFIDGWIMNKIFVSLFIGIVTTFVCVLISYPFVFLINSLNNKFYKNILIFIATAPIWTSFLVKLVGLKTFFDVINGYKNSTYGSVYTIIGLIYLYLPFMVMPLYISISSIPKNVIYASYDLKHGVIYTFFKIILPYTFPALMSGIVLVFLPSLTTVAVPQFMDNSANGTMIGDIISNEGMNSNTSKIALARTSALSFVLLMVICGICTIYICTIKLIKYFKRRFSDEI